MAVMRLLLLPSLLRPSASSKSWAVALALLLLAGSLGFWFVNTGTHSPPHLSVFGRPLVHQEGRVAVSRSDLAPAGTVAQLNQSTKPEQSTGRWIPSSTSYTYFPGNGSLGEGAINPPYPGYPRGSVYDPVANQVFFGDSSGFNISALNGSSGAIESLRHLPTLPGHWSEFSLPIYFAYNAQANIVYVGEAGTAAISFLNGTTDSLIRTVRTANSCPLSLVSDTFTGDLYVGCVSSVSVLNGVTGASVANVSVETNMYPYGAVFDPEGHSIWVAADTATLSSPIDIINDSTYSVTRQVTLPEGDTAALAYDPSDGKVFATGDAGGMGWVAAINASPSVVSPTAQVTSLPWTGLFLAFNPDSDELYVGSNAWLYVLDASSDSLLRSTSIEVATLTYDVRSHLLFLLDPANYTVALISGWNESLVRFVPVYVTYLTGALDADNGEVYIATPGACTEQGLVTILEPGSHPRIGGTLPSGRGPSGVAYDPTDDRVFVTNYCSDNLTVIDSLNNTVLARSVAVGSEPYGVVFDSLHDAIFVANYFSHNVTELNGSSLALLHTYALPNGTCPYAVGIVPGLEQVYVTNACGGDISLLNASSQTVVASQIPTGFSSQGVAYDSQNGLVYVANTDSNTITYLAASNHTVLGNIAVSNGPTALAFDPQDQLLFAADAIGSRVSVIDTTQNTRTGPTFASSFNPEGIVYVPASHQVDLFASGTGAINIIANSPIIRSVIVSPSPTELGVATTVGVVAQNGSGIFSYAYSGFPPGCTTVDAPVLLCSPTESGSFNLTATVTDSAGYASWSVVNLIVTGSPRLSTFAVTPGVIEVGDGVRFAASAGLGVPPLFYSYFGLPPGCASVNASSLLCDPIAVGTYNVAATVTDGLGRTSTLFATLQVNAPLEALVFSAAPAAVIVGNQSTLQFLTTGGTPPLSYAYVGLPPGCVSTNSSSLKCSPSSGGVFTVGGNVSDALGHHVAAFLTMSVSVQSGPGELTSHFNYDAVEDCANGVRMAAISLSANATGGRAPYTYSWVFSAGTATGRFTNASIVVGGNDSVTLTVSDSNGTRAAETERIPLATSDCPVSPPTGEWTEVAVGLIALGIACGAAIGVAAARVLQRRK
jgi:YVTN family beta-propeller protein